LAGGGAGAAAFGAGGAFGAGWAFGVARGAGRCGARTSGAGGPWAPGLGSGVGWRSTRSESPGRARYSFAAGTCMNNAIAAATAT
jgi:hypothetical protein